MDMAIRAVWASEHDHFGGRLIIQIGIYIYHIISYIYIIIIIYVYAWDRRVAAIVEGGSLNFLP